MNMKKGFTLIEIMIVVAILAILAAIAIPNFMTYRKTSQMNACKANMKQILAACEAYTIKYSKAPSSVADLANAQYGAFLKKEPKCPLDTTKTYKLVTDTTDSTTIKSVSCQATTDSNFPHEMDAL